MHRSPKSAFWSAVRGRVSLAIILVLLGVPAEARAQSGGPMARLATLDLERIDLDGVTVVYSAGAPRGLEAEARSTGEFFADAVAFFEDRLGPGLHVVVAVLGPRDFELVSSGRHSMLFSAPVDRLVVIPAGGEGSTRAGGASAEQARLLRDVIRLHEMSHAVAAAYLYPAGFRGSRPPVRWFDELTASYLAHAYMREIKPRLADFAEALARDVIATGDPHFTSLEEYERYYDEYGSTSQGRGTIGWFYNVFNRRAAELYDEEGLDFFRAIRRGLPWVRYELWTTESLLDDLEDISPGFLAWADDLAYRYRRR